MSINIECSKEGILINDIEIQFPIHLNDLIKLFGEPSRREFDMFWRVIWDELGIYTSYPTWDYIVNIDFLISHQHKLKHTPEKLFEGTIFVIAKEKMELNVSLKRNQVKTLTFKGEKEPYCISISKNFAFKERITKDKYKIKPHKDEVVEFEDFGFKLAVIQELMYEQKLLKPKFDLYEFAKSYQKRKIDIEIEGYEPIEEVTQYFKDLAIPKHLAPKVTKITLDYGNEIYHQLICFAEGDEDDWIVRSAKDTQHFPNLKKCFCHSKNELTEEFQKFGVEVGCL
jgi:hypothetical protein